MARCYVTGRELNVDEAWVLDTYEARRYRRYLISTLEVLERQMKEIGATVAVHTSSKGPGEGVRRRERRLLAEPVARSIAEGLGNDALFIPFPEYRARQQVGIAERLQRHPVYGEQLSAMELAEQVRLVKLSGAVARRLFSPRQPLGSKVRNAITGICLRLGLQSSREVADTVRERHRAGGSLAALGAADDEAPALAEALNESEGGDHGRRG